MIYNDKDIGDRIRTDRNAAGYSLEKFAPEIPVCRQTLAKWEHGEKLPDLDTFIRLCELFNCDMGHLLCEYDNRTRPDADIAAETGLSQKAIDSIKNLSEEQLKALDVLLQSVNFQNMLNTLSHYIEVSSFNNTLRSHGAYVPNHNTEEADYLHYNVDTGFRRALDEIGRTEEERRKLFKAMAPKM